MVSATADLDLAQADKDAASGDSMAEEAAFADAGDKQKEANEAKIAAESAVDSAKKELDAAKQDKTEAESAVSSAKEELDAANKALDANAVVSLADDTSDVTVKVNYYD